MARGRHRRGLPVLRRLPDDAVHRAARALRQALPEVGGVCINAESELEAVGMAWGALADRRPRRDRLDRPGPVAHAGVVLARSRWPSCRSSSSTWPAASGDYFQSTRGGGHGDYRHIVLAPMDIGEAVELTQLAFHLADKWRNPVLVYGDYLLAPRRRGGRRSSRIELRRPLPGEGVGGRRLARRQRAGRASSRRSASASTATRARASSATCARSPTSTPRWSAAEVRVETGVHRRRRDGRRRVRHAGQVRALRRRSSCAPRARRSGTCGRSRLWPFPYDAVAAACRRVRDRRRVRAVRRADDRRRAPRRCSAPRRSSRIGGISTDGSGFGVGPLLDAEIIRDRILALHRGGADATLPPLPANERG